VGGALPTYDHDITNTQIVIQQQASQGTRNITQRLDGLDVQGKRIEEAIQENYQKLVTTVYNDLYHFLASNEHFDGRSGASESLDIFKVVAMRTCQDCHVRTWSQISSMCCVPVNITDMISCLSFFSRSSSIFTPGKELGLDSPRSGKTSAN
jgi:hypothetical protein